MKTAIVIASSLIMSGCLYQSIGKSPGAFLHANEGTDFVHISNEQWDSENNALIYFYRPETRWANQELEAPSYYVDDNWYFNMRSGSWTWLEVAPGKREIDVRRPMMGFEGLGSFSLSRMADMDLQVQPGKVYYFRHHENLRPEEVHPFTLPGDNLYEGDVQLVARDYAMTEIVDTEFLTADHLAPNHAGVSIVEDNKETDAERADTRTILEKLAFWK